MSGGRIVELMADVRDGGLLMAVAELATAARCGVPLTVFVMNEDGYGQGRPTSALRGDD